jgi:hypothetical protein
VKHNFNKKVLSNKLIIDETLDSVIKDNKKMIFYKNIYSNSDESLVKIDLNDKYALLLFSKKLSFDKKWLVKKLKTLEQKSNMLVIIPELEINTIIDLKKISSIKDYFEEFNEETSTGNIISIVTLNLRAGDNNKKIDQSDYSSIYEKNAFNFVLIHTQSNQIILVGSCM